MEKVKEWFEQNKMIAIVIGLFVALFAAKKFIKPKRKKRRMRKAQRQYRTISPKRRKRVYSKSGKRLKPWQIKGSLAAKRHMAQLRKRR